eukprot:GHVU01177861.1.p1 GENE.GHVU01177861.1~~GHVU01177861.1.p1  ORF type:complete len:366 (+),score=64.85 GHVU01177861.1:3405-4502(+)
MREITMMEKEREGLEQKEEEEEMDEEEKRLKARLAHGCAMDPETKTPLVMEHVTPVGCAGEHLADLEEEFHRLESDVARFHPSLKDAYRRALLTHISSDYVFANEPLPAGQGGPHRVTERVRIRKSDTGRHIPRCCLWKDYDHMEAQENGHLPLGMEHIPRTCRHLLGVTRARDRARTPEGDRKYISQHLFEGHFSSTAHQSFSYDLISRAHPKPDTGKVPPPPAPSRGQTIMFIPTTGGKPSDATSTSSVMQDHGAISDIMSSAGVQMDPGQRMMRVETMMKHKVMQMRKRRRRLRGRDGQEETRSRTGALLEPKPYKFSLMDLPPRRDIAPTWEEVVEVLKKAEKKEILKKPKTPPKSVTPKR